MASLKNKYIELRQERDFGQIISTTFDFLFANFVGFFRTVFAITGVTFVVSMAVLSLWMYKLFNNIFRSATNYSRYSPRGANWYLSLTEGTGWLYFIMAFLVLMISFVLTYLTIYCYIKIYVKNGRLKEINVSEVWNEVKTKFLKYAGGGVIYFIFFAVVYGIAIFSATIGSFLFIMCILGVVVLIYYFYLYFNILVNEEGVSVIDAFARSYYLVKGRWWLTFGIYTVSYMLCYIITLLLSVAVGAVIGALSNFFDVDNIKFILIPLGISFSVVGVIYLYMVFCFFIIKNSVLYYSLAELKDSIGLMEKIRALGNDTTNDMQHQVKTERNKQQYTNEETEEDF